MAVGLSMVVGPCGPFSLWSLWPTDDEQPTDFTDAPGCAWRATDEY